MEHHGAHASLCQCGCVTHSSLLFQLLWCKSSILLIVSRLLRSRLDSACWGGIMVGIADEEAMGYALDMLLLDVKQWTTRWMQAARQAAQSGPCSPQSYREAELNCDFGHVVTTSPCTAHCALPAPALNFWFG